MKKIILTFIFCTHFSNAFEVQKADVNALVDDMVKQGVLSHEDAQSAKRNLAGLSDQQWQNVQATGAQIAKSNKGPNVGLDVDSASKNIDFNSKEFTDIQKQIQKALGD